MVFKSSAIRSICGLNGKQIQKQCNENFICDRKLHNLSPLAAEIARDVQFRANQN